VDSSISNNNISMASIDERVAAPLINNIQLNFIKNIKEKYTRKLTTDIISYPQNTHDQKKPNRELFYIKPLIICVPHLQFPNLTLPTCDSKNKNEIICNGIMKPYGWTDPRYIHDIDGGVSFIQFRYKCCKCNKTKCAMDMNFGYDVLSYYPVILTSKSGVTTQFMNTISTLATTGISFEAIGKAFGTYRITKYFQKRAQYECAVDIYRKKMPTNILTSTVLASTNVFLDFGAFDNPLLFNELMQPCDDFIIELFTKYMLLSFLLKYLTPSEMQSIVYYMSWENILHRALNN
jgi:hypothetical protein